MDAAFSLLKICGERLLLCKKKFDELTRIVDRLQTTLGSVEKLLKDRAKESRLKGRIQDDLVAALEALSATIDKVLDGRTSTVGKAKQFCGTCWGGGAASLVTELEDRDEKLRDLLVIGDSEVMVVQASAAEEMAGGAAGRLITHDGARRFWREQYKNELSLTTDKFFDGFIRYEGELHALLQHAEKNVMVCLRGRVDPNLDNTISVTEFNKFVASCDAGTHPDADIFEVLHGSLQRGSMRGALVAGHLAPVTALDAYGNILATGDADGFVKVWMLGAACTSLQAVTTLGPPGMPVTYLRFHSERDRPLHLFGATENVSLIEAFTGQRTQVLRKPHTTSVTSISSDGRFLFTTAMYPTTLASVWCRNEDDEFRHWGLLGDNRIISIFLRPVGDGEHVGILLLGAPVEVWNYRTLRRIQVMQLPSPGASPSYVAAGDNGTLLIGYVGMDFEDVMRSPATVNKADPKDRRLLPVADANWPLCHASNTVQIRAMGGNEIRYGVVSSNQEAPVVRCAFGPPGSKITRVCAADDGRFVAACFRLGTFSGVVTIGLQDDRSDDLPVITVSTGRWLGHARSIEMSEAWSLSRALYVPVTARTRGGQGATDCAFISSCKGLTLHIWTAGGKQVGAVPLRFTEASALHDTVSCITSTEGNIYIATSSGTICRFEVPSEVALTVDASGRPVVRTDEAHEAARREGVVRELVAFKQEIHTFIDSDNFWHSATTKPGTKIFRLLMNLSRTARSICEPLVTYFFHNPHEHIAQRDEAALRTIIEAIDEHAVPPSGRVLGLPASQSMADVLCAFSFWKPVASARFFAVDPVCASCRATLDRREIVMQLCGACIAKRPDPTRCQKCAITAVDVTHPLCSKCLHESVGRSELAILQVCPVGPTMAIVAAYECFDLNRRDSVGGQLLQVDRKTLAVKRRMRFMYTQGYANAVVAPHISPDVGPICIVAATASSLVMFRDDISTPLELLSVGTVQTPGGAVALHVHQDTPASATELYVGYGDGQIQCYHLAHDKAASAKRPVVSSTPLFTVVGTSRGITSMTVMRNLLFATTRTGGVSVYRRLASKSNPSQIATPSDDGYVLGAILQGHEQEHMSACLENPSRPELLTVSNFGTVTSWPLELFNDAQASEDTTATLSADCRKYWLMPVQAGEYFNKGGLGFIELDKEWHWMQQDKGATWKTFESGADEATLAISFGRLTCRWTQIMARLDLWYDERSSKIIGRMQNDYDAPGKPSTEPREFLVAHKHRCSVKHAEALVPLKYGSAITLRFDGLALRGAALGAGASGKWYLRVSITSATCDGMSLIALDSAGRQISNTTIAVHRSGNTAWFLIAPTAIQTSELFRDGVVQLSLVCKPGDEPHASAFINGNSKSTPSYRRPTVFEESMIGVATKADQRELALRELETLSVPFAVRALPSRMEAAAMIGSAAAAFQQAVSLSL